jgi:hypothetical protein
MKHTITTAADRTTFFANLAAITSEPPARTIRRTPEGYLYCTVRLRDALAQTERHADKEC